MKNPPSGGANSSKFGTRLFVWSKPPSNREASSREYSPRQYWASGESGAASAIILIPSRPRGWRCSRPPVQGGLVPGHFGVRLPKSTAFHLAWQAPPRHRFVFQLFRELHGDPGLEDLGS